MIQTLRLRDIAFLKRRWTWVACLKAIFISKCKNLNMEQIFFNAGMNVHITHGHPHFETYMKKKFSR
jgi:hypothetical protein